MKKDIAILLPYKEKFNINKASAASIWVKDYLLSSKLNFRTTVYGNLEKKDKPLLKNFKNINLDNIFIKKNISYTEKFYKECINNNFKIIEIHNRPNYFHLIHSKKKNQKIIQCPPHRE